MVNLMDMMFKWFSYMNAVSKFTYVLSGILFVIFYTAFLTDKYRKKSGRPENGKEGGTDGKKSGP